jgi:hypothetical protein
MTEDTGHKLGIDWLKTIAGALAAVSAAVLLSTLGAAGTIVGAAVGSVVATVGGALYSQGLARSHERVALASRAARRAAIARVEVRRASRQQGDDQAVDADLARAEERLDEVKEDLGAMAEEPGDLSWRERFVMLPWKHISVLAAGLFVVTILTITVFELAAGRTVSSFTGGGGGGGTTITRIGGGSHRSPSPSPSDQTSPTDHGTVGSSQQPSHGTTPAPTRTTPPTSTTTPTPSATTSSAPTPAPTTTP